MIRELDQGEFVESFFDLMGEVECGDGFNRSHPGHVRWLEDRINLRFTTGVRFFASYIDGAPTGFVAIEIEPKMEGYPYKGIYSEVVALGVLPELRRRGEGSRLLDYSEGHARDTGAYCLYVATYAGSLDAIRFYERNGFASVATLPDVYGPGSQGKMFLRKLLRGQPGGAQ